MKIEKIEKEINKKIIDYIEKKINIEDLNNYVHKIDPSIIFSSLMNSKRWSKLCQLMEAIEDYDFYKDNGDENITIKSIIDYYNEKLKQIHIEKY
jgi:uncharacterized protein (UPF0128 family)